MPGILVLIIVVIAIATLWVMYSSTISSKDAPKFTTEPFIVERMIKMADVKEGDVFADLGSGDGRFVVSAALHGAEAYGIESDPLNALYAKLWIFVLGLSNKAKIVKKNLFDVDLRHVDVVAIFLTHETTQKLKDKFKKELKPGSRIVSYSFPLEGWTYEKAEINDDALYGPIFLYKVPSPKLLKKVKKIKNKTK